MSKGNYRREMARIAQAERGRDWKHRAKRHLLEDLDVEVVTRSAKVVGIKLGSGRVLCTKTRFKTEGAALQRLSEILADMHGENKKPCRAYQCTHCNQWHLTSWPHIDQRPI